jgi:hypothetical protein
LRPGRPLEAPGVNAILADHVGEHLLEARVVGEARLAALVGILGVVGDVDLGAHGKRRIERVAPLLAGDVGFLDQDDVVEPARGEEEFLGRRLALQRLAHGARDLQEVEDARGAGFQLQPEVCFGAHADGSALGFAMESSPCPVTAGVESDDANLQPRRRRANGKIFRFICCVLGRTRAPAARQRDMNHLDMSLCR